MTQVNPDESRLHAGDQLRIAREAAGLEQAEVAARLKMPLRVVRSLEEEDWSRLGAPVFVRGQLRSYARLLGIDAEPVVEANIERVLVVDVVLICQIILGERVEIGRLWIEVRNV